MLLFTFRLFAFKLSENESKIENMSKTEWKERPLEYMQLIDDYQKTYKPRKQCPLSHSNSADIMMRLSHLFRYYCNFTVESGKCKIKQIKPDLQHCSLSEITFNFNPTDGKKDSSIYTMTHRWRNPFNFWIKEKGIKEDNEYNCNKLIKQSGTLCSDVEWDFIDLDWT